MSNLLADITATLAGRYRIERELGRGGMGTVFLADDLRHGRKVALKVLSPQFAEAIGPERFTREIQLAARLTHPHILTVLDSGEATSPSGQPLFWYTMQFIEGESLAGRLEREGRLPVGESKHLLREVADALAYAHGQGVLHRDIKPANILLTHGHALVADLGIAKPMGAPRSERLTETGLVVGTPGYMSPEQAAGEQNLDARSDLFSLGCVYYEMLTGQSPFGGASPQAKMARALSGQFTPVEQVRPEAAGTTPMFTRLLAPDPADRYPDAGTLVAELDQSSDPALAGFRPQRHALGRPWLVVLAATLLLGTALVFGWRARTTAPVTIERMVVLPFQPVGATAADSGTADLVLEGLPPRLARVPGLLAFAVSNPPADEAAADFALRLGVRYALAGAVTWGGRESELVQVQARVIEVVAGAPPVVRWQDSFAVSPARLYEAQIRIARGVTKALGLPVRGEAASRLEHIPTENGAAYLEYLRVRTDGLAARTRFERAVALDPRFVEAWAEMAISCAVEYRRTQDPSSADCARRGAERALALDSLSAPAQLAFGLYARSILVDFRRAKASLERAAALEPNSSTYAQMLVSVLISLGEWEEAWSAARRSGVLDPTDPQGPLRLAAIALARHRFADAEQAVGEALSRDSLASLSHVLRATIFVEQGDLAAAQHYLDRAPFRGERLRTRLYRANEYGEVWYYPRHAREEFLRASVRDFSGDEERQWLTFAQVHWLADRKREAGLAAENALRVLRQEVQENPEDDAVGLRHALALALAGHTAAAVAEGTRAALLRPVSKDGRLGPESQLRFAEVLAIAGAGDSAIAVLTPLVGIPGPATAGRLSVDPYFASLRGDARFDRLAGLSP